MKMPNLQAVGTELLKLQVELEEDAKKFIGEVQATREHKDVTFGRGREQLVGAREALGGINKFIDELDKATNGGPTLGGSLEPSAPPVSVSVDPSEVAQLAEVK